MFPPSMETGVATQRRAAPGDFAATAASVARLTAQCVRALAIGGFG